MSADHQHLDHGGHNAYYQPDNSNHRQEHDHYHHQLQPQHHYPQQHHNHPDSMTSNGEKGMEHLPHQMYMYLTTSTTSPFLIKGWNLQTVEGLLAALVLTLTLAMLREAISYSLVLEEKLMGRSGRCHVISVSTRIRRSFLHVLQTATAALLMLSVMTYNVWLLAVLGLGSGVGYFLFRPCLHWIYIRSRNRLAHQRNEHACNTIAANGTHAHNAPLLQSGKVVLNDEASAFLENSEDLESHTHKYNGNDMANTQSDFRSVKTRTLSSPPPYKESCSPGSTKTSLTKVSAAEYSHVKSHSDNSIQA